MAVEIEEWRVANHPHWYPLGDKTCWICGLAQTVRELRQELKLRNAEDEQWKQERDELKSAMSRCLHHGTGDCYAAENVELKAKVEQAKNELRYWHKTYRSHTGFMNAQQLEEKERLEKLLAALEGK